MPQVTQAWIDRALLIETEARSILGSVDDALKLRARSLLVCTRRVLERNCDDLAAAINAPEPPFLQPQVEQAASAPVGAMQRPEALPRLFEGDAKAIAALDHLLDHPEEIADHLMLAGGFCQGQERYGCAAAVLIAADQLRRRGIL